MRENKQLPNKILKPNGEKTIKTLTAIALTAVLAFVFSGCSSDGGDDPVLPLPPAHVHAYSDSWTSNETHHWHVATCGHDEKKRS